VQQGLQERLSGCRMRFPGNEQQIWDWIKSKLTNASHKSEFEGLLLAHFRQSWSRYMAKAV